MTKPFRLAELWHALCYVVQVNETPMEDHEIVIQDIRLDVLAHRFAKDDQEVLLSAKEFELLRELMVQAGNVVERDYPE